MSNPIATTAAPTSQPKIEARNAATAPADAGIKTTSPAAAVAATPPPNAVRSAHPPDGDGTPVPVTGKERAQQVTPPQQQAVDSSGTARITDVPEKQEAAPSTRTINPSTEAKTADKAATSNQTEGKKSIDGDPKTSEAEGKEKAAFEPHWTENLATYYRREGMGALIEIGSAISEIMAASGEIAYQDAAAGTEVSDENSRLGFEQRAEVLKNYKTMVKSEVEAFRTSIKELTSDLESTFEAIKSIAKQNKELAASGRKQ
jgi:hypothetical protein